VRKRLQDRITESFPKDGRENARQYLEWLRAALSDLSASLRRTAGFLLVLVAVFEFIIGSPKSTYVIAGFQISKGSVVLSFIPALVAYSYFQLIVDSAAIRQLHEAFSYALDCWSPLAGENDLDVLVGPSYPLYWTPVRTRRARDFYPSARITLVAIQVFGYVILVGVLAFECQAYYALLPRRSVSDYVIWSLSLCITLFCTFMAISYVYIDRKARKTSG
jgi:hypothetical protein